MLCRIHGIDTILDWKTGKATYPEMGLQLASYAYGDFLGEDDDVEVPLEELGKFRDGLIVRLGYDGSYAAVPFALEQGLFESFLGAKAVYEFSKDGASFMGKAL
jgi:hypothetical protein